MHATHPDAISVVISTYERPAACERALRSILAQTDPPLEVLICDNGSTDDTQERMRGWEQRDARVRYLRTPANSGTPATTRNLGIEHALGELIAFCDDDDEWLPAKLARQRAALASEAADAVSTNALRSDGSTYFPIAPGSRHPTWTDLLSANPIITSSALVRRDELLSVGGFPTEPRLSGLEDYATWLELARRGTRFVVLVDALVRYDDSSGGRLSLDRVRIELAVARLAWRHALRDGLRPADLRAALRRTAGAGYVIGTEALRAFRPRPGRAGGGGSPRNRGVDL